MLNDYYQNIGMKGFIQRYGIVNYLSKQIKHAREDYHEDMIFMYAWNEWAEGGYLEPDEDDKYGYLEAIKRALEENNEFPEFQNKKNENDKVK